MGSIDAACGLGIASNTLHMTRGGKDSGAGAPAGQTFAITTFAFTTSSDSSRILNYSKDSKSNLI
jgi:hypothetical protein